MEILKKQVIYDLDFKKELNHQTLVQLTYDTMTIVFDIGQTLRSNPISQKILIIEVIKEIILRQNITSSEKKYFYDYTNVYLPSIIDTFKPVMTQRRWYEFWH